MSKKYDISKQLILTIIVSILLLLPPVTISTAVINYNDDDTPEIIINEIISPPSNGRTGFYDVTTRFTSIGIIVNGEKDYNEPWIEHEQSPDNDASPNINFYTSCDEENMYIAFENITESITKAEIFIDKNMNGVWNNANNDSLFMINFFDFDSDKVKDYNGNPIPNSCVGWANQSFVEVKIPKTNWTNCQNWAYIVYSLSQDPCDPFLKNPSWGNNTSPSTPPDNTFLNSTCNYDSTCPCGVAFKAYTDIFKINPGDCSTIYETDFENLSNVTCEWKTESIDNNPDTWNLSKNRSNSPNHSFHCTDNTNYYGNSLDILEMKNTIDLSDVINVSFSFFHWCKGDTYTSNGHIEIVDYGDIEIYAKIHNNWIWISLSDLGISNLYYNNDWTQVTVKIEKSNFYPLNGENISGEQLLTSKTKFRFVWKSSPQFQYEGWYIDDVSIKVCTNEWYNPSDPIWQGWEIICMPLGSTTIYTFPLQWNANEEGKYLIRVCFQEERPWHSPVDAPCLEKIVTIGDIHDVAVTSLKAPNNIDDGENLYIKTSIKNVGTYDESDIQVKATIKKEGDGSIVWQETAIIPTLNISDEITMNFTWKNATYCNHILEIRAILPTDEVPLNNSKSKIVVVATTIFEDNMDNDCNWIHSDLTGGEGHWNICTSGDNNYLWCGLTETTKYDNNWNDVAMINRSFDLSSSHSKTTLTFNSSYRMNQSDYGYVEISPDNGRHWETISTFTGYSDWQIHVYNISAYNTANIKVRFRFFSNQSITNRGWVIDNVTIANETDIFFNDSFESGTTKWIIEGQKAGDWWQRVKKEKACDANNMAWWCGDETTGMYPSNLNNALILDGPCASTIDLSKAFDADILFSSWYNISKGDKGIIEISNNGGTTWNILSSITNSSNTEWINKLYSIKEYIGGKISIRFRFTSDNADESEGWYIDDFKIVAKFDTTPPKTTSTLSGTMGNNDWYTSPVQITLTAVDDYTGVKHIYYNLDNSGSIIYTSPITVSNGNHTIEYWSEDNIGNVPLLHNLKLFKVDSLNPSANITKPDNGIYWRDHKIWPLIKWSLFKWATPLIIRDITITVSADDTISGVDHVDFYVDNNNTPMSTDSNKPFEWNWDKTVFFTHTITVKVYDKAGNEASLSKNVRIFNINLFT